MVKNIRDVISEGNDKGDKIPEREHNALYFPESPIHGEDMIASENFTSIKDIELSQQKNEKTRK